MDKRRSKTNALLDAQRAGCPAQQEMPESPCAPSALRIRARHGSPAGRGLTAPPAVRSPSQRRACAGGGRNVGVDGNQANERPVHAAGKACEKSVAGAGAAEAATVASASAVDASIDGDAAVAAAAFLSSSHTEEISSTAVVRIFLFATFDIFCFHVKRGSTVHDSQKASLYISACPPACTGSGQPQITQHHGL